MGGNEDKVAHYILKMKPGTCCGIPHGTTTICKFQDTSSIEISYITGPIHMKGLTFAWMD